MTISNTPRVKLLVWHHDTPLDFVERFRAHSVVGTFSVWGHPGGGWSWSNSLSGGSAGNSHLNADEAKAAAQADFVSKILSALDAGASRS